MMQFVEKRIIVVVGPSFRYPAHPTSKEYVRIYVTGTTCPILL